MILYVMSISANKTEPGHSRSSPDDFSAGRKLYRTSSNSHLHGVNNPRQQREYVVSKIQHRDLRRLEYSFNPLGEPAVLIRRHAVLVSFDPLRAVVMADRLIVIIPDGADQILELLEKNLNG